jgi:ankyrin repeat protein
MRAPERRARAEAFFQAAVTGDEIVVSTVLAEGHANPNTTDVGLYTVIHRVVEVFTPMHANVADLLVAGGGDVNASQPGLDGWTPLRLAAWKGSVAAVRFLLSVGAGPALVDWYGQTAGAWALKKSHPDTTHALKRSPL